MNAAKQFLEEVKIEEKKERPMADGNTHDDNDGIEKDTTVPAVTQSIKDEHPDLNEGSVTCNQVDENGQLDPNKGSVTCNKVDDEERQLDPMVTCNEIIEGKQNDPNEGSVAYNEENVKPTDETTANGDVPVEKVKGENERGLEKSEPPADFLSGKLHHLDNSIVMILLLQLKMLMLG